MRRISVVMCTRNRPDFIGRAVGSVLANDHSDFDLIIVDQSTDGLTERELTQFKDDSRFRYLHVQRPGLSAAYNRGIRETEAPLIAFTDDDCVAPPNWLQAIESAFQRDEGVDMLYGQTIAARELKGALGVIPELVFHNDEVLGKGHRFRIYGMGADFAIRRRLFERIGGFDEALGGGGPLRSSQDFDYQYRAYKAGALTLLCSDVWVEHYGLRANDAWTATMEAYGAGDGAFYFKHVRCGDWQAAMLLAKIIVRGTVREILDPIRKRGTHWPYWRGFFMGIRNSLSFQVDKQTKLYRLRERGAV